MAMTAAVVPGRKPLVSWGRRQNRSRARQGTGQGRARFCGRGRGEGRAMTSESETGRSRTADSNLCPATDKENLRSSSPIERHGLGSARETE